MPVRDYIIQVGSGAGNLAADIRASSGERHPCPGCEIREKRVVKRDIVYFCLLLLSFAGVNLCLFSVFAKFIT